MATTRPRRRRASSAQPAPSAPGKKTPNKAGGISPASVRVAVLNGTTVPGLAAQIADSVEKQGFKLGTVTNFNDQQRAESVVLYAPGAEREAAEVGRRLKISQREPIDAESQGVAGDATVVIVTGQDKTQ
ncbi:MAG: LytR C-terminal domain-containing protein [Thermoleophilaceae bacterium]